MVICPIAVAVGCRKCPAFAVCPLKTVIGDAKPEPPAEKPAKAAATRPAGGARQKAGANRKGARARRPRK